MSVPFRGVLVTGQSSRHQRFDTAGAKNRFVAHSGISNELYARARDRFPLSSAYWNFEC